MDTVLPTKAFYPNLHSEKETSVFANQVFKTK